MDMGPVEYVVVAFPGNKFKGEIVPALRELTESGTIRIIDLVFIKKDEAGNMMTYELSALPRNESAAFDELDGEVDGLLSEEDIQKSAEMLAVNSSAAVVVFEHVWATRLRDAVVNADGLLVANGRVAPEVVEAAMAYAFGTNVG